MMSNHPKKKSELSKDQERLNAKMQKRKKSFNFPIPPFMFIVSEGTKTEVTYMKGFTDVINKKYYSLSSQPRIVVLGTGRSCSSLLQYARRVVKTKMPQAEVVWLMYDQDDFPKDDFDNTDNSAKGKIDARNYKTAWSNESLELWFVLHFQDLSSNVSRAKYIEIIKKHIPYKKNDANLFETMRPYMEGAIIRAKIQYNSYPEGTTPSKMCPATKVFELVEELKKYL